LTQRLFALTENLPALVSTSTLLMPQIRALSYLTAPDELYRFFADASFHTIYPDSLREPQKPGNDYPLDERGQNLASVLRSLQRNPDTYGVLNDSLGRVVEGVSSYSVRPIGGFLVTRLQHASAEGGRRGPAFDLSQESDGTLRMLGILAALYQEPARALLTIEEPELTIHPGALGVLCDVIQEASARSQVIITTHSPDLIDRSVPNRVAARGREARRGDQHRAGQQRPARYRQAAALLAQRSATDGGASARGPA
jgi:predicted ATPase